MAPDSLSLGSFGALCKISNFEFLKHCSSPNFHPIHPNIIQGILIIQAVTFLVICQKLRHFEIFSNTGATGIFKVLFLAQFSLESIRTYDNIGYNGSSKCLLEYCNVKLASSTQDNIFYSKIFKTFLCAGSSVQAERQGPWVSCLKNQSHNVSNGETKKKSNIWNTSDRRWVKFGSGGGGLKYI